MKPITINGQVWQIERVSPDDPLLIDRTGKLKLATTDLLDSLIRISNTVEPPLLDRVVLHEIAHAIMASHGLLPYLRHNIPDSMWIQIEEWSASFMEQHAIEAVILASQALGRPVCTLGYCIGDNYGI